MIRNRCIFAHLWASEIIKPCVNPLLTIILPISEAAYKEERIIIGSLKENPHIWAFAL